MIAIKDIKMPSGCNKCNFRIFEEGWGDYCAEGTCFCDIEFARSIPVTEAIRKMAEALCHKHCTSKDCTGCDEWEKYETKDDAEAALNALLKGVKK